MEQPTTQPPRALPVFERYKYVIFTAILVALVAGIGVLIWQRPDPATIHVLPPEPTPVPSPTAVPSATATPGPYAIYITGAVATPETVVTLGYGSRVLDALAAVGGALDNADLKRVNLAQRLEDGDQVHVPTRDAPAEAASPAVQLVTVTPGNVTVYVVGEVAAPDSMLTLPDGSRVQDALDAAGGATGNADLDQVNLSQRLNDGDYIYVPPLAGDTFITPTPNRPRLVHINSATLEELETLPGIGPALGQAIIDYRSEHGPFASIEALDDVSGIGPATIDNLRALIAID